jgi:hypothetical protein
MVFITIVTGAYKPTYNWRASHCNDIFLDMFGIFFGIFGGFFGWQLRRLY